MAAPKSPTKGPLPPHEDNTPNTGEQDQGIPFKGPSGAAESSAVDKAPDLEPSEFPPQKSHMASALRRDSFQNIGQRRRSSASNQPSVNLRRAQGYSKENEMARNVGA